MRSKLLLLACLLVIAFTPAPTGLVTLLWNPSPGPGIPDSYNIYHSTDLSVPLTNWLLFTNVTATSVVVFVQPGLHYFVCAASNFWGESGFSNVTNTPNLLLPVPSLGIRRGP